MGDIRTPFTGSKDPSTSRFSQILYGAAVLAFLLLMYTVRDIVNPFAVGAVTMFLAYPLRREAYARRLLWAAGLVTLGWGLYDVREVLAPFVLAFVLAFLFDPVVTRVSSRVPRWVSALVIMLTIIGVAVLIGAFVIPPLFAQLDQLLRGISTIVNSASSWYSQGGLADLLVALRVPEDRVQAFIAEQLSPRLQSVLQTTMVAVLSFIANASSVIGQIVNVVLVPVLGFYLLKDFSVIRSSVKKFLTTMDVSPVASRSITEIDRLLSAYLRGQLLVAVIIGTLAAIIFSIAGVPYAFVLGLVIAVLDVVPYVGLIASIGFSLAVVLLGPAPTIGMMVFVFAVTIVLHMLETYVIAPRIIGGRVGLHPVAIILSVFVFAHELGFLGLVIAVPASAVVAHLVRTWIAQRSQAVKHG